MTPRDGPVAWAIRRDLPISGKGRFIAISNEPYDPASIDDAEECVVPLYAHPAATAREEAFYEAALAYFESDKARMAAFTGEVFIEGPESAAIAEAGKRLGAARAAYAALALTRSVKGTEA